MITVLQELDVFFLSNHDSISMFQLHLEPRFLFTYPREILLGPVSWWDSAGHWRLLVQRNKHGENCSQVSKPPRFSRWFLCIVLSYKEELWFFYPPTLTSGFLISIPVFSICFKLDFLLVFWPQLTWVWHLLFSLLDILILCVGGGGGGGLNLENGLSLYFLHSLEIHIT